MQIVLSTVETQWIDENRNEKSRQAFIRELIKDRMSIKETTANTGASNDEGNKKGTEGS